MKRQEVEKVKELIRRMDFDLVPPEVYKMLDTMVDRERSPGQQILDALPKEMFEASGMIAKFIEELLTANPYSTPENAIGYRRGLEEVEKRLPELFARVVEKLRKSNGKLGASQVAWSECCDELEKMLEEKP